MAKSGSDQLFLSISDPAVCNNDSVEVEFYSPTVFGENNKFSIQLSGNSTHNEYESVISVSNLGKFKIRLSDINSISNGSSYVNIRVTSSNPVMISPTKYVQIFSDPNNVNIEFNPNYEKRQYLPTDKIFGRLTGNGLNPTSFVLNDGFTDKVIEVDGFYTDFPITPKLGSNTFTLKSLTTQCGVTPLAVTSKLNVVPFTFRMVEGHGSYYSSQYYGIVCPDVMMSLPIVIMSGKSEGSTFEVQAKKSSDKEYVKVIGGLTKDNMNFVFPISFSDGYYSIRVVSSEGVISEDLGSLSYMKIPSASLSSSGRTGVLNIEAGQSFPFSVKVTGTGVNRVVSNFANPWEYESQEISSFVNPYISTEYKLKSVSNQCGYGTVSGVLTVNVKPKLTIQPFYSNNNCVGSDLKIGYRLDGDTKAGDYILFELILQGTTAVLKKDSTKVKNGDMIFKLPENINAGNYILRVTAPQYVLSQEITLVVNGKPEILLSGSSNINKGGKASLFLTNKNFGGYQSLKYQLSDGSSGEYYEKEKNGTNITVSPNISTNYTIKSISNVCGVGKSTGSALISVNPPSARTVDISKVNRLNGSENICSLDSISVEFSISGAFSAVNKFTIQLSDSNGTNFRNIPTVGSSSPLKGFISNDYPTAMGYRIRISASDSDVGSGTYQFPLNIRKRATVRFETDLIAYQANTSPKVVVKLEGDGPWQYFYGTDANSIGRYTIYATDTLTLLQASPSVYCKLYSVSNACGLGILGSPSTVRVEVITGLEDPANLIDVKIYPNPSNDYLILQFKHAAERTFTLYNFLGTQIQKVTSSLSTEGMDIRSLIPGTYLINIQEVGDSKTLRIVKE